MTFLIYIAAFLALLGVLVTIHEFGHFIFARIFKVHVQRFSVGMGPVIYKKKDKFGTEFALSAIPLGGYVSMITEKLLEIEPETKTQLTQDQLKNTFDSKPKWQRALIMFAGPLANFILSIFLFTGIFMSTLDPHVVPVVSKVESSISEINGSFKLNDRIKKINGVSINEAKDLNLELLRYAGFSGSINFSVEREGFDEILNLNIDVENFLPSSESQTDPMKYLGIMLDYKMEPIIGNIVNGGSAERAGIFPNDRVLSINNNKILFSEDIRKLVQNNANKNLDFKILRNDQILYVPVKISSSFDDTGNSIGILGVTFGTKRTFFQAFSKGAYETYNLSIKTLQFIGKMFTGSMGTENLSGPIGIAQMAGNTAQAGLLPFIYLMALLSISLAVINLLPIPVLDGGQLTLLGIEAIRGKPLAEKTENFIYTGGALIVGALMIFAIFNDISRFIG